jgi:hypothetical protein
MPIQVNIPDRPPFKLADKPVRYVLEGVPRVGYFERGENQGLCSFPACLRAYLRYCGEYYPYSFLMGVSRAAFRLLWKPGWHPDNVDILVMAHDVYEPVRRAFYSVGYSYRLIDQEEAHCSEGGLCKRIVSNLLECKRPVLAFGVIGPPECCLITGYDDHGAVLIGWNYFQDFPEFNRDVEYEESGYFRKRDWYEHTIALLLIGERTMQSAPGDAWRKALCWASKIVRAPMVRGRYNGLNAYSAWAQMLLRDEEFIVDSSDLLRERMAAHDDAMVTVAEGRWCAAQFLRAIAQEQPIIAGKLLAAAGCYEAEHDLMWQGWQLIGGIGRDEEKTQRLAEPGLRRQLAQIVLQAQAKDRQAIEQIEQALDPLGGRR